MLTGRLPDKTVRVGETLEYSLPVGGEPMPVATWVLNAAILTPSDIVNISVNRQLVELMICPAQKIHNGVLVLKLTNSAGELKLQGNVRVFGKLKLHVV